MSFVSTDPSRRNTQGYPEPETAVPGSGLPQVLPSPATPPNPNYRVKGVKPGKEYVAGGGNIFLPGYIKALSRWFDDLTRDVGADIYERMLLDYQCSSCLRTLIVQTLEDGVELHPAIKDKDDPDYEAAQHWLTFGNYVLDNLPVCLEMFLREQLYGCGLGHRLAEQTYVACEDGVINDLPIFKPLRGKEPWIIGSLKTKPRRCYAWVQDVYANTVGVIGLVPGQTAPVFSGALITAVGELPNVIPRDKFISFCHDPWYNDPRGSSLFRCVYVPWFEKLQAAREFLKFLGRFGSPIVIGTTPQEATALPPTDGDGNVNGATLTPEQALLNACLRLENGSAIVVPFGTTVQVIQPSGEGSAFLNRIKLADDQIAKGITLQTLATEQAAHQARAAAEVHQETGASEPRYLKTLVADMLYRDLLMPLVLANGGKQALRLCPRPTLSPISTADRWSSVQMAAGAGYHLDDSQMAELDEQLGMPPRDPASLQQNQQGQEGQQQGGGDEGGEPDDLQQWQQEVGEGGANEGGQAGFAGMWEESKHQRGNPKNRGQFAPKGGGGGASPQKAAPQQAAVPKQSVASKLHPTGLAIMNHLAGMLKNSPLDVATRKEYVARTYRLLSAMTPEQLEKVAARTGVKAAAAAPQGKVPAPEGQAPAAGGPVDAEGFKKFFGDWKNNPEHASKVVNSEGEPAEVHPTKTMPGKDGKPMVVYHGTSADFEKFDKSKQNEDAQYGPGFYFTEDEDEAKTYAGGGKVHAVYLNIRNPFNDEADSIKPEQLPPEVRKKMEEVRPRQEYTHNDLSKGLGSKAAANKVFQQMGYDGFEAVGRGKEGKKRYWIAFEPEQILRASEVKDAGFARVRVAPSLSSSLDLHGMDRRGVASMMLAGVAGSGMSPMEANVLMSE